MKLLLDENLPHDLRPLLMPMHDVYTVTYLGWNGTENGALLALAASNGFDALITMDRGMQYQQNAVDLPCSVVVLLARENTIDALRPLVVKLLATLSSLAPQSLVTVASDNP
jgi:predicted nuclease of predicted toxin-antitoxin system